MGRLALSCVMPANVSSLTSSDDATVVKNIHRTISEVDNPPMLHNIIFISGFN